MRSLLLTALVALLVCPAAAGHGGGATKGYSSVVTSVSPRDPAVRVTVLDGDDRLQLRVARGHAVLIRGYEGEPYLRFGDDGVFRNTRSPATYLNEERYGSVELPGEADPDASAVWERVASAGRAYAWHDHRIHWMSTSYPPAIEADRSVARHVFDWTVPGALDGRPLSIRGSLDYRPLPGQRFPTVLFVPLGLLALAVVALGLLRLRAAGPDRRRRPVRSRRGSTGA